MSRVDEPGWVQIGLMCAAGRRSLWFRVSLRPAAPATDLKESQRAALIEANVDPDRATVSVEDVVSLELCAGREGDDAYVQFDNDGSQKFYELWDVLCTAEFAGEEVRGSINEEQEYSASHRG